MGVCSVVIGGCMKIDDRSKFIVEYRARDARAVERNRVAKLYWYNEVMTTVRVRTV